jgi:ABC-type phosphate transport system substrate-binding protein
MKVKAFARMVGVVGAIAVALAVVASPASADPGPPPDYRTLAGVGSDTTQDVGNGLGNVVLDGGNKLMASWDARGSATITPKDPAVRPQCANLPRPNGSSAGRNALEANPTCYDFARSSSYSAKPTLTYVPFGVDAMTWAKNAGSDLPDSLTFVQLQRIYRCLTTVIGGVPVKPLLPQSGSGTRQFWLQKMVITEADITNGDYPCLVQTVNGQPVQEHDGTVLNGNNEFITPFSAGQFIAQTNAATIQSQTGVTVEDRRGPAALGRVNGLQPIVGGVLNVNFRPELVRDVYNVVLTSRASEPVIAGAFIGANSKVCQARSTIELFGFGFRTTTIDANRKACGDPVP